MVSYVVADERLGKVVQGGHEKFANLAGRAGLARLIQDLSQNMLRLGMVVLVIRTLQGDVPDLPCRVDVYDRHAPCFANRASDLRLQVLRYGNNLLKVWQLDTLFATMISKPMHNGWMSQQVIGVVALQPFDLLFDWRRNIETDQRTSLEDCGA